MKTALHPVFRSIALVLLAAATSHVLLLAVWSLYPEMAYFNRFELYSFHWPRTREAEASVLAVARLLPLLAVGVATVVTLVWRRRPPHPGWWPLAAVFVLSAAGSFAVLLNLLTVLLPTSSEWVRLERFGALYLLVLLLATFVLWLWFRRWQSGRKLAVMAAAMAAILVYLAWDVSAADKVRAAGKLPSLSPRAAEGERLYLSPPSASRPPWRNAVSFSDIPFSGRRPEGMVRIQKRLLVLANREAIRADWDAAASARDWIAALDRFEMIGDSGAERSWATMPYIMSLAILYGPFPTLLAVDDRGAEALALWRSMLSVVDKLRAGARSPRRLWTAANTHDRLFQNAHPMLQFNTFSASALWELAADLERGFDVSAEVRALRQFILAES